MEGLLYRAAAQSAADPFEFVLSDETVDRYGDVIVAGGWDINHFKNNPIALFNHNADAIIGRWEKVRLEGKRLLGHLVLASAGTSQLVDEVRKLWDQKMVRAVSVGFRPIKQEPLKKKDDDDDSSFSFGPTRYLQSELVECSLVAVPANPNALPVGRSFELSADARRQLFGKPAAQEQHKSRQTDPRVPAKPPTSGSSPMSLTKRIETAQKTLNDLRDKLTELAKLEEPGADDVEVIDELTNTQIPAAEVEVERLQRMERTLAIRTVDPGSQDIDPPGQQRQLAIQRPFALSVRKVQPVDYLVRSFAISLLSYLRQESPDQVRKRMYGDDESTLWVMRAVTNPALTSVPEWAGELVQTAIGDFLNLLQPVSVFPTIRNKGTFFTFDRTGGIIRIPSRTSTQSIAGAWVGEGAPIPVRRIALTSIPLTPKKLGVISSFTQEMADYSTPNIEAVIRQSMAEDTAIVIDTNLLDDVAADAIRPAGLRNGVTETPPSDGGPDADPTLAMIADLRALVAAIIDNNGGRDIVIIMNPLQSMGINFAMTDAAGFLFPGEGEAQRRFSVTFASSTTVTKGMLIAVDCADFTSASGAAPDYSISNQATVHEESENPLPIVSNPAGHPPGAVATASPVRSYWQTDSIGIRMRLPLNWAMRRTGMVSWMDNVIW